MCSEDGSSISRDSRAKKHVQVTDSAEEYSESPSGESKSPVSHVKEEEEDSGESSPQSLPSSPRRLQRTLSNGVKKMVTSEMFSADNDLSRSLEVVYTEPPAGDERRKLSERYRHTSSSSGASNGSVNDQKIEKRKASVTRIKKSSGSGEAESSEADLGRVTTPESATTKSSSPSKMELQSTSLRQQYSGEDQTAELTEKKVASPTRIQPPASANEAMQVSSEVISPLLEVESKTPEKKPKKPEVKDQEEEEEAVEGELVVGTATLSHTHSLPQSIN